MTIPDTTVASIRDRADCERAASLLKDGHPIGTYIRGTCGLWADGHNPTALDSIYQIKGERRKGRPLGTILEAPAFVDMLDPDGIEPSLHDLVLDPDVLADHLASICFIRAPLDTEVGASLPDRVTSQSGERVYWLQNWLPRGSEPARTWVEALRQGRIELPAATSMNVSGKPELVDQEEAATFCQAHQVPMFLADPKAPERAKGSFPIIKVGEEGIVLVREGHFPARIWQDLMGRWPIDLSQYEQGNYPLVELPASIEEAVGDREVLKDRLIRYLDG